MAKKYIKGSTRPLKVMTPYTTEWECAAKLVGIDQLELESCDNCGGPVVSVPGYECRRCGSEIP